MIEINIKWMEYWKSKLGISDYGVAWISVLKGLVIDFATVVASSKNYFEMNNLNRFNIHPKYFALS